MSHADTWDQKVIGGLVDRILVQLAGNKNEFTGVLIHGYMCFAIKVWDSMTKKREAESIRVCKTYLLSLHCLNASGEWFVYGTDLCSYVR